MTRKKSWTIQQLRIASESSYSIREVISKLGLIPAGGNYEQLKKAIRENNIDTSHFTGSRWNVGRKYTLKTRIPTNELLVANCTYQSYKLKRRLFQEGIKRQQCELCGWAETSVDGRIPVELDHINGDHYDNRIENLRILCPNCHSLQSSHRGRNKKTVLVNKTPRT